jgi:asparagine synthase (glutamine-hydrolysing)
MCGITGIFCFDSKEKVDATVLTSMRDSMIHRGPDGGENWISDDKKVGLAHRRLSIIDLSTSATQPMANEDRKVMITFNGEIYNHLVLRKLLVSKGHIFQTDHSDTEVLIHGYEEWGIEGLLENIEGDYAFAIWDENIEELVLARDRVGVKPLYFSFQNGTFLFGSEIKSIISNPLVERDIDSHAMFHYLSFLTTPAPMTMFKGIFKLPSGYYMKLSSNGAVESKRYWDAIPGKTDNKQQIEGLSEEQEEQFYLDGIRKHLINGVEKRMMADVPIGVFLSGGIDSSVNVALMSKCTQRPLETFTIGFKDYKHLNELEYARLVSDKFNTNHHEVLIDESDMISYLDDLIYQQDEPVADWVCIPLYFVSKLAKEKGVTVVQVGEGSDEQFSGYGSFINYMKLEKKFWDPYRKWIPKFGQKIFSALATKFSNYYPKWEFYADIIDRATRSRELFWTGATVFWDVMKMRLLNKDKFPIPVISKELRNSGLINPDYYDLDSFNVIKSFLEPLDKDYSGTDTLNRMIYNEFQLRLPELLLMRVDKIAMSVSLEARVPFLDHKLIEFTMDIPQKFKIRNNEAKYLFKKAVRGIIPDEIIDRKKMGFGAPMSEWLKGDFGKKVHSSLFSSKLMEKGFFNKNYIEQLFSDHFTGKKDNSLYLWTLFNLTAWYDYWIVGDVGVK